MRSFFQGSLKASAISAKLYASQIYNAFNNNKQQCNILCKHTYEYFHHFKYVNNLILLILINNDIVITNIRTLVSYIAR